MIDSNDNFSIPQGYSPYQNDWSTASGIPPEHLQELLDLSSEGKYGVEVDLGYLPGYPQGTWCLWIDVIGGYLPSLPREDWE